jgi:predicted amidohydrolase
MYIWSMTELIAACIQISANDNAAHNIKAAEEAVRDAAARGAQLITLPENVFFMQAPGKGPHPSVEGGVAKLGALADKLGVWIVIGSVHVPSPEGKSCNRSLLINNKGAIVARYDKIHLFDVTLKNGETYAESDRITPGGEAVLAQTPWGKLGLTVCYDVRFAHLYRALAHAGADIITVPAAFTYTTGTAHWHVLLRARAIETGCFIIAPAQCGIHPGERRTYGHSLIISPWGEILAEGSETDTGIILATLNMNEVQEARAMIPALSHDRPFKIK